MYYQRNRSKTILHVLAALLLSAALSTTASAQNVAYSDGTFSSGWTNVLAGECSGNTNSPMLTLTPHTTGGTPGDWLSQSFTLEGTSACVSFFVYNPANNFTGTFASLNYSYDLQNQGHSGFIGYQIAIEQNGAVYIPYNPDVEDGLDTPRTAWANEPNPFFDTGMIASQFCEVRPNQPVDCNSNPSFSTPTTTTFGFTVGTSWQGGGPGSKATVGTGIDNWCVVLVGASGPGGSGPGCDGVSNLGTGG